MRIRLSSFWWPANATASIATPSCMQPSPARQTMWWSKIVCSAVLNRAAAILARHGHADGVADALAERPGGGLDAVGVS